MISEIDQKAKQLISVGKHVEALTLYQQYLAIFPKDPAILNNYANTLFLNARYEEALEIYGSCLEFSCPPIQRLYPNIAKTYRCLLRFDEAINSFEKALALSPSNSSLHNELGVTHHLKGEFEKALFHFQKAIEIDPSNPSAEYNRASTLLLLGDWETAGRGLDARFSPHFYHKIHTPYPETPFWNGEDLVGKVMIIFCDCGFGDVLQFIRYVSVLAQAEHLHLLCPKPLIPFIKEGMSFANLTVHDKDEVISVKADYRTSVFSLPFLLNTSPPWLTSKPYFHVKCNPLPLINNSLKMKVGLCWTRQGRSSPERNRSVSVELLEDLLSISEVQFYSLQLNAEDEFKKLSHNFNVIDLSPHIFNFLDTSSALLQMDLVVTIDTALAHLAGALGRATWVLLPFVPDWRWGLHDETTPWYSHMQLFRQTEARQWRDPLNRIKDKLSQIVSK